MNTKERRTNAIAITNDIKKYLDSNNYITEITSEFHVVVFSASGGTGSVAGPAVISNLRMRNIPVIGIVIGDSSNGLSCKNTLNTLATLDHISKVVIKKPVTVIYYNNENAVGDGVKARESAVNDKICKALTIISVFLSGCNEDLDSKDMINFLSPDNYSSIKIDPSLYCINIHVNGTVSNSKDTVNLIGRTLSCPDEDTSLDLTLLQHKYGKVIDKNAIKVIDSVTPLHMVLAGNCLVAEHTLLKNTVEEYDNIMTSITTKALTGAGDADVSGMIF